MSEQPRETTPLLASTETSSSLEAGALVTSRSTATLCSGFLEQDSVGTSDMVKQETEVLVGSSIPLILAYFLQFSFNFVNILSLGHLGADELAGAALANMTLFMLVNAPSVGLASALDTFCATSFTASPDKKLVGFHLQRGLISVTVHFFLMLPVLLYIEPILVMLRQDALVAQLCSQFVRLQLLGSLPWMYFECIKRFIQAQGHMKASTVVLLFVLPFHLANNYLLVWSSAVGIGFLGAALANVITFWAMFIGIVVYCWRSDAREAWGGWTRRAVAAMPQYYQLAIPSMILMCSDWAAWELMAIAASYLGNVTLAAQTIVINTCSLTFQIPAGLSIAVSNRVGNLLGQERARRSQVAANVGLSLGALSGALSSVFCLFVGAWWGRLYSSDPEVIATVAQVMPICALFQLADALNGVSAGVLRSLGRQSAGAWINFPAYYIIGFPLGLYLTYGSPGAGAKGLWMGLSVSVIISAFGQSFICIAADYIEEVRRCMAQVNKSQHFSSASSSHSAQTPTAGDAPEVSAAGL
ncbi:ethionine resistance protein [Coemansia interrupta]|uniref:Ethionine resistance protein n=1 Tax=Coemansia interrupta TaxID=1126814 RepID=A0A9W8HP39_9FUNG|nr:ethionine resistance protein [Coemansia interrupta]